MQERSLHVKKCLVSYQCPWDHWPILIWGFWTGEAATVKQEFKFLNLCLHFVHFCDLWFWFKRKTCYHDLWVFTLYVIISQIKGLYRQIWYHNIFLKEIAIRWYVVFYQLYLSYDMLKRGREFGVTLYFWWKKFPCNWLIFFA